MDIFISLPAQTLELFDDHGELLRRYSVSTAKNGAGEQNGSFRTPRGKHLIRAKIGAGCAENTVFVKRRPTGEIWTPELHAQHPGRDWILSRILWLSGRQPGFNRLSCVDTMRRYVYLHGTHEQAQMGAPGSIGCVRMRSADIVELFDLAPPYIGVNIGEYRIEEGAGQAAACQTFLREHAGQSAAAPASATRRYVHAIDPEGNLIGAAVLQRDAAAAQLTALAVAPAWRRLGVATNLLRRLLEVTRTDGALWQGVWQVRGGDAASQAFLRQFGFRADPAVSGADQWIFAPNGRA